MSLAGLPTVTQDICATVQPPQQTRGLLPCPPNCPSSAPQTQNQPPPPPQTALLPTPPHTHAHTQHAISGHNHMLSQVREPHAQKQKYKLYKVFAVSLGHTSSFWFLPSKCLFPSLLSVSAAGGVSAAVCAGCLLFEPLVPSGHPARFSFPAVQHGTTTLLSLYFLFYLSFPTCIRPRSLSSLSLSIRVESRGFFCRFF